MAALLVTEVRRRLASGENLTRELDQVALVGLNIGDAAMRLDPVIVDVAAREASPTKLDRVAR
jgi:hypothetical protein